MKASVVSFCLLVTFFRWTRCNDVITKEEESAEPSKSVLGSQDSDDFMTTAKVLTTLDFHGSDLIIFEHPDNVQNHKIHPDNRFYVMPVVEIDVASLEVHHSFLIDAFRMDFNVILWTEDLKTAAVQDLERLYGENEGDITLNQVQMIPMKEVRLIWNSEVPLPDGIWLSRDWIPFSRNPHRLRFSFMCEEEDVCQKLKTEMKKHPGEFRKLNLEFTTNGKSSFSKELHISGINLVTTEIFRDLQNDDKFQDGEEDIRYLTAEDLQILSVEVTENVVATTAADGENIPKQQRVYVADALFNRLASTKVSTVFMSKKAWNSTRWEPDFARPDKVVEKLNAMAQARETDNGTKVLKLDEGVFNDAEYNYVYANEFKAMKNFEDNPSPKEDSCDHMTISKWFGSAVNFNGIKKKQKCNSLFNTKASRSIADFVHTANAGKTNIEAAGLTNWKISLDTLNNYLSDRSASIEFRDEKFKHKPMDLFKVSMADLAANTDLLTTDVQVQKMQKIYHIKVTISTEMTSPYQNDLERIADDMRYLTYNLTNNMTELEEELKHETLYVRREMKDEMATLQQKHEHDIVSVRMENDQKVTAVRQEYKQEITNNGENLKREIGYVREQLARLENITRVLAAENNALKAVEERMELNLSQAVGQLTSIHNDFRHSVIGEITFLRNFTRRIGPGDISFMATSSVTRTIMFGGYAIFDKVIFNDRNGYNNIKGDFTAPIDGLYLFYFSLYLKGNGIEVRVYVDNTMAFKTRDSTSTAYQYPSGTFMVQLRKDQKVHMKFSYQTKVYEDINTWFGGHLVKQL